MIRSAMSVIAASTSGATVKPSWAANRAARIIRSGSSEKESSGRPGVRSTWWARSTTPPNGSSSCCSGSDERHRVHREVAAREVADQRVAVLHGRLAARRVVGLGAVRRDLDLPLPAAAADRAELAADVPGRLGPALEQPLGDLGARRGGEVEVVVQPAEHRVANRTADQGDLLAGRGEAPAQLVGHRGDPRQLRDHARLDVADQQGLLGHEETTLGRGGGCSRRGGPARPRGEQVPAG